MELNKCYLGDCLDIMRDMPDKCVDLVLTDPPYGLHASSTAFINGTSKKEKLYYDNSKDWDNQKISKEYFEELMRISNNQIIFGGNYYFNYLGNTRCFIIWDKTIHGNSYSDGEFAWTSFNKVARIYPVNMVEATMDGRVHPTQKPLKLIKNILMDFSEIDDIIFDPFAGSHTTAVACINTDRKFICVEKDEEYYKIGVERVKKAQAQGKLAEWF